MGRFSSLHHHDIHILCNIIKFPLLIILCWNTFFQNFLGFGQSAEIDIVFEGNENRKFAEIKTEDGKKEKYLLYYDGETVSGKVSVVFDILCYY